MLDKLTNSLDFNSKALVLRAERQRSIAGNIANADTPGYAARDFSFSDAMRNATAQGANPAVAGRTWSSDGRSDARHIPLAATGTSTEAGAGGYTVQTQPTMDGNSVDLDRERAAFADNAVRYEATLRFINGQSKTLISAITGAMTMSMFSIFGISGSAVSAQSQRLNVVASNLANADAVAGPDGQPYKARQVVFQTVPMGGESGQAGSGVRIDAITENQTPGRKVHEPANPMADAQGYVTHSNVNAVEEMVNMISASRSYQNNVEVMNTAKNLLLKTLQLGQ